MTETRARRISAFVTIVALCYFFWRLISVYGVAGVLGSLLAFAVVVAVFLTVSRVRGR